VKTESQRGFQCEKVNAQEHCGQGANGKTNKWERFDLQTTHIKWNV